MNVGNITFDCNDAAGARRASGPRSSSARWRPVRRRASPSSAAGPTSCSSQGAARPRRPRTAATSTSTPTPRSTSVARPARGLRGDVRAPQGRVRHRLDDLHRPRGQRVLRRRALIVDRASPTWQQSPTWGAADRWWPDVAARRAARAGHPGRRAPVPARRASATGTGGASAWRHGDGGRQRRSTIPFSADHDGPGRPSHPRRRRAVHGPPPSAGPAPARPLTVVGNARSSMATGRSASTGSSAGSSRVPAPCCATS